MKKIVLLLLVFILFTGAVFAENKTDKKFQLSLIGGISHVFEYGSEDDYVLGENDFPVTPAHTPPFFGLSFSYFPANKIKLELDWRYALSSKITLTDPSDEDTVEIDSSGQYFVTLNFVYQCIRCNLRPYFLVGAGINKLCAKAQTYTTEYGYEVNLEVPDKTTAFVAQFGGGLDALLGSSFGLKLDLRFIYLFTDPDNIAHLFGGLGFYFLF